MSAAALITPDLALPTREEMIAWRLRHEQELTDGRIAALLKTSRQTANGRIRRAERKIEALRLALADGEGDPVSRLLSHIR